MKATVWMLLALLAAVMLLAACPRKTDGAGNGSETSTAPEGSGLTNETMPEGTETTPPAQENTMPPVAAPVKVEFETTKGKFVIEVHPEWAPLGAAHFVDLVNDHFYDGAPWFRVVDGFVAQCGISADPAMNEKWSMKTIQDEPVIQGNKRSFVSFGSAGPNTRSTHIFVNLADNDVTEPGIRTSLDEQGFPCFGQVIEGMDVVDSLARVEYADQGGLAVQGGLEKFKTQHPDADYIISAKIIIDTPDGGTAPVGLATDAGASAPGATPAAPPATPPAAPPAAPEGGK